MRQEFLSFMFCYPNIYLPELKLLDTDNAGYLEYYYYLRYSLMVNVANSNWERFHQVMESFDAVRGFKRTISKKYHLLELIQGKITDVEK